MHLLPRPSVGAHRPRQHADSGFAPEIVLLMLTVAGAILFIAYRVMGGTS